MKKPPLYRSVNTRTHNVRHGSCRTYRQQRHSKSEKTSMLGRGSMHSHHRHGFDYTPLFRFLLSKVGHQWDAIFSEANSRLDRPDPVFWMWLYMKAKKANTYERTSLPITAAYTSTRLVYCKKLTHN